MMGSGARWACVAALMVTGAGVPTAGVAAEIKIGVVDMQRALNECDAGKKAKDQVKAKFEKAGDQLKRQREELDRAREDYEKKAIVLKDEERRNLEKDLEGRALEFKRKSEDLKRDLERTDRELTSGIVADLYGVVQQYGKERGYTVILEAQNGQVVFADEASDITAEVVKIFNTSPRTSGKRGKD
ncbi:MAG: OmpH family outer membrane protein [Candidatus Binatia bacterium]